MIISSIRQVAPLVAKHRVRGAALRDVAARGVAEPGEAHAGHVEKIFGKKIISLELPETKEF